jgi:hypothetical protein
MGSKVLLRSARFRARCSPLPSSTRQCTRQFSGRKFALPHLDQEYRYRSRRVHRKTGNTKIDSSESTIYQPAFKAERLNKDAAHPKYCTAARF